jgi:signal transduction histidine kinase
MIEGSPRDLRELSPDELDSLRTLSTISEMLNGSHELDEVLNRVLEVVVDALKAQRGFLMLDVGQSEVQIAAARGTDGEETPSYSHSVVHQVLADGEPVLSHDASADARFVASQSLHMIGTRSIMCVPLRTRSRNFGLIYLDNQDMSGLFTPLDLELLQVIAGMAAAAIERAQYMAQLIQNEKLAALGSLVAGIAHELNNPLTVIMGLTQLLSQHLHDQGQSEMTDKIHKESVRCRNLVRQLLSLARQDDVERQRSDLGEVVRSASALIEPEYRKHGIKLDVDIAADLPQAEVNPEQWTQVMLNLLGNARHAVRDVAQPRVRVKLLRVADRLRLLVADNGNGIPRPMLKKVFDPFFTTKPVGEGTGLGLSITQSIIVKHGGSIRAANDPHGGAMFVIELPFVGGRTAS